MRKTEGNVIIEKAMLPTGFRNFSGKGKQFNAEGNRNFCIFLDDVKAEELKRSGWNVKYLRPREEGDKEQPFLQVSVNYNNKPPKIILISSRGKTLLNEETVLLLDWAEIEYVDIIITPYNWTVGGKSGVRAYLKSMYVTIYEDDLEKKYINVPDSGGPAFIGGCGNCETCDGTCSDCDD